MNKFILLFGSLLILGVQVTKSQDLIIKKLPFSKSNQSEIAPYLNDSLLYFSSNKNISWLNKLTDQNRDNFYNLYTITQSTDSMWYGEQQYQKGYFSDFHTGTISFSSGGDEVYFTESQYKTKKRLPKGATNLNGVFVAKESGGELSRAKGLPFNSRRSYNTGHPTISPDGNYLYFVSDQQGGYGGADLYVSERQGQEWGEALNLGAVVNTGGNEIFPYFHPSGKLFFASDSLGGKGGYDIFYTLRTENGWEKPVALDIVNSEADEFSCFITAGEQSGYFASNRDGDDDLFEFFYKYPVFGPGKKQKENTFKYRFFDEMNGKGDGPLKYVWHFGDGEKAEGDTVIHQYKMPGNYHVQSILVDTLENLELFVLNDFHQEVKKKIQVYINCPDEVKVGEQQVLDAKQSILGDFDADGFYWELPDGTKQKGETIQYIFRTKGIHKVKCGTISKSDPNLKMCTFKEINVID